jgi:hypothetical protein
MFYVLVFGILAVVLVVGVLARQSSRRRSMAEEDERERISDTQRKNRRAERAQSRKDRRKRH